MTYDGVVLAKLDKIEAVKAHCIQVSSLYNFNANYNVSTKGKALTGESNYFDFVSVHLWNISKKDISSGDGVSLKKRKIVAPVLELIGEILNFQKKKEKQESKGNVMYLKL